MKIAVLLATYNRKEKTVDCLKKLYKQILPKNTVLQVFLTDDASSDGTVDAIKALFPLVNIFNGSGSLFWAGGMRNSWNEALKANADYYLLLNDDTTLNKDAINQLISFSLNDEHGLDTIYVGSTQDDENGEISYGGRRLYSQKKVQSFLVYSDSEPVECDMANANIMLVPRKIVDSIGILSKDYTHSIADFDYTLKAKRAGFKVIVVPGVQGYCTDDHGNNWKPASVPLSERIKYLKSPKGLAYHEYLHFIRVHFPSHLPVAFFKLWIKTLFPSVWSSLKHKQITT